jgi:hypothetical protein
VPVDLSFAPELQGALHQHLGVTNAQLWEWVETDRGATIPLDHGSSELYLNPSQSIPVVSIPRPCNSCGLGCGHPAIRGKAT